MINPECPQCNESRKVKSETKELTITIVILSLVGLTMPPLLIISVIMLIALKVKQDKEKKNGLKAFKCSKCKHKFDIPIELVKKTSKVSDVIAKSKESKAVRFIKIVLISFGCFMVIGIIAGIYQGATITPEQLAQQRASERQEKLERKALKDELEVARKKEEASKNREKQIEAQFSAWDESHIKLKRLVKGSLKDPKSFEHDITFYTDNGDYLLVSMRYRAKNSFGGYVASSITAKANLDGDIIEIVHSK